VSNPYVVNVSSIQDFYQCRYRWYCKWVLNRVPRHEGPALEAGKLLHLIFEKHSRDDIPLKTAAVQTLYHYQIWMCELPVKSPERATAQSALDTIMSLMDAFPLWQDVFPMDITTLEAEEPFEISFPEMPWVVFRGRPDRVCLSGGAVWHVQNRGLAASMNFGTYALLAKRHYHEHLYAEHLSRKYADLGDYGGTIFNLVRKLKFRTNVGKKNEKTKTAAEMFWQMPVAIALGGQQHRDVMRSMFDHVRDMQTVEKRVRDSKGLWLPPPNEKMNGGFNGSTPDPYFRVLTREIDLMDDAHFKNREDTYAVADVDAGQD
jgi:hypothetical protein